MSGVLQGQDFQSDNLKSWNLIVVTRAFSNFTSKPSVAMQSQKSFNRKYFLPKPNNERSLCHSSQHGVRARTSVTGLTVFLQQLSALCGLKFWEEPNPEEANDFALLRFSHYSLGCSGALGEYLLSLGSWYSWHICNCSSMLRADDFYLPLCHKTGVAITLCRLMLSLFSGSHCSRWHLNWNHWEQDTSLQREGLTYGLRR